MKIKICKLPVFVCGKGQRNLIAWFYVIMCEYSRSQGASDPWKGKNSDFKVNLGACF